MDRGGDKDAYKKNVDNFRVFLTLCLAVMGAELLQLPCRVIFGRFCNFFLVMGTKVQKLFFFYKINFLIK